MNSRTIRGIIVSLLIITVALTICGCGNARSELAGKITNVKSEDGRHYSCDYMGITREYSVYCPQKPEDSVLVMALHGYGSDADSFARDTLLHESLCPEGYTVAYVSGIPDPDDKTAATGWNSGLKKSGNDDAGFLSALACYLQKEYKLNEKRLVAVGFSNGAFMTHRLATDESRIFTDIVSVAGMMPQYAWEERPDEAPVNVLQISGTKDDVVPQKRNGSDKYSKAPAIEDVMDYYAESSKLDATVIEPISDKAEITRYTSDKGNHTVWEVSVRDGRHSWFEENFCGFNTNDLILDFLSL